jgi:hypothetical protein
VVGGEGDEDWPIVFLNVWKTAAVIVLRLHKTCGPLGRLTGSETRSHTISSHTTSSLASWPATHSPAGDWPGPSMPS